jgi:hypothetical protein
MSYTFHDFRRLQLPKDLWHLVDRFGNRSVFDPKVVLHMKWEDLL